MKSFDAFLIAMLLVLLAATGRLLMPFLPGGRRGAPLAHSLPHFGAASLRTSAVRSTRLLHA